MVAPSPWFTSCSIIVIGIWLDSHHPGNHSWTLTLLIVGLAIGCFNAWHWVDKEDKEMRQVEEDHDE